MESQVVYYGCLSQGWKKWYFQFWSKISQNKFKLGDRVWISYGQNYVFFTSSFKPTVVLYGGFSEFVYSNFRSKITLKILCFCVCSVRPASPWVLHVSPFCTWVLHVSPYYASFMFSSTGVPMGLARVPKISNLERFLYFW